MSELRAFIFNCEFGMLISFKDALAQLRHGRPRATPFLPIRQYD
jgi:hypothetical protein